MLPNFLWKLANFISKGSFRHYLLTFSQCTHHQDLTHFAKSFILNQKHKGGAKPQYPHGLAELHFPQIRAEEMRLVLSINRLSSGKPGFLGSKHNGISFPVISSLLVHFHTAYI